MKKSIRNVYIIMAIMILLLSAVLGLLKLKSFKEEILAGRETAASGGETSQRQQEQERESSAETKNSVDAERHGGDDTETDSQTSGQEAEAQPEETGERAGTNPEAILAGMSLEEKAAQIFFVTPEAITGVETATAAGDATKQALAKCPVGGLVYFPKNILNPQQTEEMLKNTWEYSKEVMKIPVYLGVDEEGGTVARVGQNSNFSVPRYTSMREIGDSGDIAKAYQAGNAIGSYLKELGFNMDFAPDADVITNPENKVIGNRSFGTDGELVGNMAMEAARGFKDSGIAPCVKHFPGHGGTKGDTHEGYAYTDKTIEQLKEQELVPFQKAVEGKIDFIMVSHISVPASEAGDTPASLSSVLINGLLKEDMGYEGIVITDAMNMGAISQVYSSAQAAVEAFNAGADMLLMPENFEEAYQGILTGVREGVVSEERLNEGVLRILKAKTAQFGTE